MSSTGSTKTMSSPGAGVVTPDRNGEDPVVTVAQGRVRGKVARDGARFFLGVPYAAPPVGARRFAVPHEPASWSDVRDARVPGPSAPQSSISFPKIDMLPLAGDGWTKGDDYLTLNVWTPHDATGCPVMLWIHGGGGTVGKKDIPVNDGAAFARSGVVYVAINFRMGVEGFLPVPGAPTNLALRDMQAALRWVQANIAAFGGDPNNVTIFGESAGGMHVASLLGSPLSQGLFARAIVQSGHGSGLYPIDIARRTVDRVAKLLKIRADAESFRQVAPEALLNAQGKVMGPVGLDLRNADGFDPNFRLNRFNSVYGDDVLPVDPLTALRKGAGTDVDLLIGACRQEGNLWFVPTSLQGRIPGFAARWLLGKTMPRASEVLKAYGLGQPGMGGGGAALNRALTDLAFRWPSRQFAAAHRGRTHVFEFDWMSPALDGKLGACHGVDLPFVFDTLDVASGPRGILGENPPQALATRVHALWAGFARTGELPWPEFDEPSRAVHRLSADTTIQEEVMPASAFLPN